MPQPEPNMSPRSETNSEADAVAALAGLSRQTTDPSSTKWQVKAAAGSLPTAHNAPVVHNPNLTFPEMLMEILSDPNNEDTISWLPHGCSFRIHNRRKFLEEIMPKYDTKNAGRSIKWTSFTRKFNRWDITRLSSGPDTGAFYHRLMQRERPELASKMTCRAEKTLKKGQMAVKKHKASTVDVVSLPGTFGGASWSEALGYGMVAPSPSERLLPVEAAYREVFGANSFGPALKTIASPSLANTADAGDDNNRDILNHEIKLLQLQQEILQSKIALLDADPSLAHNPLVAGAGQLGESIGLGNVRLGRLGSKSTSSSTSIPLNSEKVLPAKKSSQDRKYQLLPTGRRSNSPPSVEASSGIKYKNRRLYAKVPSPPAPKDTVASSPTVQAKNLPAAYPAPAVDASDFALMKARAAVLAKTDIAVMSARAAAFAKASSASSTPPIPSPAPTFPSRKSTLVLTTQDPTEPEPKRELTVHTVREVKPSQSPAGAIDQSPRAAALRRARVQAQARSRASMAASAQIQGAILPSPRTSITAPVTDLTGSPATEGGPAPHSGSSAEELRRLADEQDAEIRRLEKRLQQQQSGPQGDQKSSPLTQNLLSTDRSVGKSPLATVVKTDASARQTKAPSPVYRPFSTSQA